jgi:hypothetical protein
MTASDYTRQNAIKPLPAGGHPHMTAVRGRSIAIFVVDAHGLKRITLPLPRPVGALDAMALSTRVNRAERLPQT